MSVSGLERAIFLLNENRSEVMEILELMHQKNKEQFETKLRDWRDLDDFVQVKIPKPIEPTPLLVIHQGYDVTSVDRLLDRKGVFATIESSILVILLLISLFIEEER